MDPINTTAGFLTFIVYLLIIYYAYTNPVRGRVWESVIIAAIVPIVFIIVKLCEPVRVETKAAVTVPTVEPRKRRQNSNYMVRNGVLFKV